MEKKKNCFLNSLSINSRKFKIVSENKTKKLNPHLFNRGLFTNKQTMTNLILVISYWFLTGKAEIRLQKLEQPASLGGEH